SVVLALILILALLGNACIDLSAISKFADSATEAGQRFPKLAADLIASCVRQHVLQDLRDAKFAPVELDRIAHPAADSAEMQQATARCQNYADQQQRLTEANAVLIAYLKTMADLASDKLTDHDKSLDALGTSFTGANIFNEPEVNAVKGLAKLLSKATSDFYRRNKLKSAIEQENDDVQKLTAALKRIVIQNYVTQLDTERDQLRSFYRSSIQEHQKYADALVKPAGGESGVPQDPLPVIQVKQLWDRDVNDIDEKIAAANAYAKLLDNVATAHQKLYESRNKLSSKEAIQIASQYSKSIQSLVADFRKAF